MHALTEFPNDLDKKLLLAALTALKKGDFSVRMPSDLTGLDGKIADTQQGWAILGERRFEGPPRSCGCSRFRPSL